MEKWYYKGEADITIGEYIDNRPKYVLYIIIGLLGVLSVFAFVYRVHIYDFFVNPQIVLKYDEYEVSVGENIDLSKMIADNLSDSVKVEFPSEVDTTKIGEYNLVFKSSNTLNSIEKTMLLKVVDKKSPFLELSSDTIVIDRDKVNEIDVKAQLKDYGDNYDNKESLIVEYPENVDFSKEQVDLVYKVSDSSGNSDSKTLRVFIKEKVEPSVVEVVKEVPTVVQNNSQNTQQSNTQQNSSSFNSSFSVSRSSSPYISGVKNHTVKVGTNFNTFVNMVSNGVMGSGYVSVNYSSVNLTKAGTYKVYYSGSDGASVTSTITVVD